jgi:hypothetical protein
MGEPFTVGRINAWIVQHGGGDLFVESGPPADEHHPMAYLGRLGDSYVLYEAASRRLLIVRTDKVGSLVLVPKPSP